jgi:hypothetical protein
VSGTGQTPEAGEGRLERVGWRVLGASGRVVGVRVARRVASLVLRVRARVLDRAGVDGDEARRLLGRLGYEPTGQVLPVASEVCRPAATTRPPPPSTR